MLESFSFKETLTCFMVLFAVIDILGSVPIIVSLRKQFGHIDAERASIVSGALMIVFLFVGKEMLKFIGIDVNSFAIAGALVIFIIALEMILGIEIHKVENVKGSFYRSDCVSFSSRSWNIDKTTLSLRAEFHVVNIILGILLNTILVYIVSKICQFLRRKNRRCYADDFQKSFWNYPFSDFY